MYDSGDDNDGCEMIVGWMNGKLVTIARESDAWMIDIDIVENRIADCGLSDARRHVWYYILRY